LQRIAWTLEYHLECGVVTPERDVLQAASQFQLASGTRGVTGQPSNADANAAKAPTAGAKSGSLTTEVYLVGTPSDRVPPHPYTLVGTLMCAQPERGIP